MEKPPRIEVLPLVPGEYAKPMRGMKSFLGACGAPKTIKPGISSNRVQSYLLSPAGRNGQVLIAQSEVQTEVTCDLPDIIHIPTIHLVVARKASRAETPLAKGGNLIIYKRIESGILRSRHATVG